MTSRVTTERSTAKLYAKVVASRRSPSIRLVGFEPTTTWFQTTYATRLRHNLKKPCCNRSNNREIIIIFQLIFVIGDLLHPLPSQFVSRLVELSMLEINLTVWIKLDIDLSIFVLYLLQDVL